MPLANSQRAKLLRDITPRAAEVALAAENATKLTITFRDIVEGRAFVRLSAEAKVKLCHRAGAPWNEKKPDAKLHPLQVEILRRPERIKIIHGGSRLGKSTIGACEALCEAILPGSQLGVVAARFDHVGAEWRYIDRALKTLFPRWRSAFPRLNFKSHSVYHVYEYEAIWGATGRGFSTDSDDGASLLGLQFTRAITGEASHLAPSVYDRRLLRAVDGALATAPKGIELGYVSLYTTPRGDEGAASVEWDRAIRATENDLPKIHYGRVPFARTMWLREAAVTENPDYDRGVFEARKQSMLGAGESAAFEEQYLGKRTMKHGAIFVEHDRTSSLVPLPTSDIRRMQLATGMDTGAFFGGALVGLLQDGLHRRRYVLTETYTQKGTIYTSLDEMKEKILDVLTPTLGLPANPDHAWDYVRERIAVFAVDPASQHKQEIMEAWDVALVGPKLELLPSIELLRKWMAMKSFFVVEDECPWLLDQMEKYQWKVKKFLGSPRDSGTAGGKSYFEPRKGYDHMIDAMRLALCAIDEEGPLEADPDPITMADAFAQAQRERVFGPLRIMLREAEERGGIEC